MSMLALLHQFAQDVTQSPVDVSSLPKTTADSSRIKTILSLVFTVTGAIAVMMIVIGGIKYAASNGDPSAASKAKGTIIYAIVGLILSILSVSIVDFVIGKL